MSNSERSAHPNHQIVGDHILRSRRIRASLLTADDALAVVPLGALLLVTRLTGSWLVSCKVQRDVDQQGHGYNGTSITHEHQFFNDFT